ncbi:MAG: prepilin-type N-terminal cleavage/methylation domain-containing protein [Elusimicrobiota bacterium]
MKNADYADEKPTRLLAYSLTRCHSGVTLIEVLAAILILSIICITLARFSRYAFETWWTSSTKLAMQQEGREVLYWLNQDMKGARFSSIGTIFLNTGFEQPYSKNESPESWDALPDGITRIGPSDPGGASNPQIKSGFYSCAVSTSGVYYSSAFSTITVAGNYYFTGFVKTSSTDTVAEMSIWNQTSELKSLSSSTTYWVYKSTTILFGSGDILRIRLKNSKQGLVSYFDDVSLIPQNLILSESYSSNYYGCFKNNPDTGNIIEFETYITTDIASGSWGGWQRYRFRYDPVQKYLYREYRVGSDWAKAPGLNPVAENVKSLNLLLVAGYINISVETEKILPGRGNEKKSYTLQTRIYPMLP